MRRGVGYRAFPLSALFSTIYWGWVPTEPGAVCICRLVSCTVSAPVFSGFQFTVTPESCGFKNFSVTADFSYCGFPFTADSRAMGSGPAWSQDEDEELCRLVRAYGCHWSAIAQSSSLPWRSGFRPLSASPGNGYLKNACMMQPDAPPHAR